MIHLPATFRSIIYFAIALADPAGTYAQGTWTKKADFPGSSRNEGIGFTIGSKGYFGMGQKQVELYVYKSYTDFWEYDSEKNTWTQKSDFPGKERLGTKGFLLNGKIYAGFGYIIAPYGPNAGSNDYLTDLYKFDPDSNKWSKKNDKQIEGGSISFVIKDTLFYVNAEYRVLKKYDPATDTWTESSWTKKSIAPKYADIIGNNISFSIKEKEYIITSVIKKGSCTNQLWEFDPHTISWIKKNDLPLPGSDTLNAFSIGENGYLVKGGNDILKYDPASDTWSLKNNIPAENKYFSPAFIIGERIYGFSKHKFWEFIL